MRGNGRIFARGPIYWVAYSVGGKEYRESSGSGDRGEAEKLLRQRMREKGADELGLRKFVAPKNHRLKIHDLLEALGRDYELRGKLTPKNKSNLRRAETAFGHVKAVTLTSQQVDIWIAKRIAEGAAPATINRVTGLVSQACKLAIERSELASAPLFRHLSEAGNERRGFFEADEFSRLLERLPDDLKDYCRFAYITGWRKNEIASLTWSDIEENVIRLRGENAKNGQARSVVIAGELAAIIERRRQARMVGDVLTNFVFHREGAPVQEFRKSWASACVKAGLGRMTCARCGESGEAQKCPECKIPRTYTGKLFHDFRRTAVRDMIRSGVPQSVAMKISGHKTSSMFRRYDITDENDLRQAIEAVERYHETAKQKVERVVAIGAAR